MRYFMLVLASFALGGCAPEPEVVRTDALDANDVIQWDKDVMGKKNLHPLADQFSDDDMNQIKRYGQMIGGGVTPFDEAVEEALNKREAAREANAKKMKAAQTGEAA